MNHPLLAEVVAAQQIFLLLKLSSADAVTHQVAKLAQLRQRHVAAVVQSVHFDRYETQAYLMELRKQLYRVNLHLDVTKLVSNALTGKSFRYPPWAGEADKAAALLDFQNWVNHMLAFEQPVMPDWAERKSALEQPDIEQALTVLVRNGFWHNPLVALGVPLNKATTFGQKMSALLNRPEEKELVKELERKLAG